MSVLDLSVALWTFALPGDIADAPTVDDKV